MPKRAPDGAFSPLPPVAEATRAVTLALAAALLGLAVAYAAAPAHREWLRAGNGLTDAATALLFPVAAAVGWWAIRRTPGKGGWRHLIPIAALLGFADELHFGAGFLGFDPPRVGPVAVDGVSALVSAAQHEAAAQLGLGPMDLLAGAALVAAAGAILMARQHRAARAAAWLADHPAAVHLLAAAALGIVVVGLELLATTPFLGFLEEWLEFASAAVLLRGALVICLHEPQAIGWRQRLRPWLDGDTPQRAMPSGAGRRGAL